MKKIPLTYGAFALVDDFAYGDLSKYNWSVDVLGYVQRRGKVGDPCKTVRMHRQIMGHPKGMEIDHKDGNRLNHQGENLRLCTRSQNIANGKKRSTNTSGYIGVGKARKKWLAQIKENYRHHYLGVYETKEEAARVRDKAAVKYFGEFAKLNFPVSSENPSLEANKARRLK